MKNSSTIACLIASFLITSSNGQSQDNKILEIATQLRSTNKDIRTKSMLEIEKFDSDKSPAIPYLMEALKDCDEDLREHASRVLRDIGSPSVPYMVKSCTDPDSTTRRLSAKALGEMTPYAKESFEPLSKLLRDKDVSVRRQAAIAFSRKKDPRAVPHLAKMLQLEEDNETVTRALWSLYSFEEDAHPAIPQLISVLRNHSAGSPILLQSDNRLVAAQVLAKIGKKATVDLMAVAKDESAKIVSRGYALQGLKMMGDEARVCLPDLIEMIGNDEQHLSWLSIRIISGMGSGAALAGPALEKVLDEGPSQSKIVAALALLMIGSHDKLAHQVIMKFLTHSDRAIRLQTISGLTECGVKSEFAIDELINLVNSEDQRQKLVAAKALGNLGAKAKKSLLSLKKATNNNDPDVREAANEAIRMIEFAKSKNE